VTTPGGPPEVVTGGGAAPARATERPAWRVLVGSELLAGACVGAFDTVWAVVRGVGGLTASKAIWLVLLGASWSAVWARFTRAERRTLPLRICAARVYRWSTALP